MVPANLFAQDADARLLGHVAPEFREAAKALIQMDGQRPPFSRETLPAIRKGGDAYVQPPLDAPAWQERVIAGPEDTRLRLFVINASPGASKPAILHTHGGGYITGSAKSDIRYLQAIAQRLDCVIVTVDYRLAPETTWRGSVEDNHAGLKWLYDNAAAIGADRARIAVMGESAGGGHAALLALAARDRGEVPLVFQCLVYPMLDDRTGTRVIPPNPVGELLWTGEANRFGWEAFLGMPPGTGSVPLAAVPARRMDLAGLPPAWIGVGGIDLFVDEDVDYAQRLLAAGVPTQLLVIPGAFHGFYIMLPQAPLSRQFYESMLAALARAFGMAV
jgi:acetyl esterase/lipase